MSDKTYIIAVDFDGTLAKKLDNYQSDDIGEPILPMIDRVRKWLWEGKEVYIFTARVHPEASNPSVAQAAIEKWCFIQFGTILPVTCLKDPLFREIWDDKAVQLIPDTGLRADGKE